MDSLPGMWVGAGAVIAGWSCIHEFLNETTDRSYKTISGLRSRLKSPTSTNEKDPLFTAAGNSICVFHEDEVVASASSAPEYP